MKNAAKKEESRRGDKRHQKTEDEGEDAKTYISWRTDAATFGEAARKFKTITTWKRNGITRTMVSKILIQKKKSLRRSTSVGESVRSELENARRASANTTANAATMSKKTEALDGIRRDVDVPSTIPLHIS